MTLDTPATLKALARTNDIAKARRLAINAIDREARSNSSLSGLQAAIADILNKLQIAEANANL